MGAVDYVAWRPAEGQEDRRGPFVRGPGDTKLAELAVEMALVDQLWQVILRSLSGVDVVIEDVQGKICYPHIATPDLKGTQRWDRVLQGYTQY
jgi:hypothetical protein